MLNRVTGGVFVESFRRCEKGVMKGAGDGSWGS